MPKTIQIREVDDETYASLRRRAAEEGSSVPEFLRGQLRRIVARPSITSWLDRSDVLEPVRGGSRADIIAALDDLRGPWPDDRR